MLSCTRLAARIASWLIAGVCVMSFGGCFEEEKVNLGYLGVNHTPVPIDSVLINGEGGILNEPAMGGGGESVCCVTLPKKWRPGLRVTIKWRKEGDWLRDAAGNLVLDRGRKTYVPGPWLSQTVDVPEYTDKDLGHFDIHFMPHEQIIVKVMNLEPWHPSYVPPYPEHQQPHDRQP